MVKKTEKKIPKRNSLTEHESKIIFNNKRNNQALKIKQNENMALKIKRQERPKKVKNYNIEQIFRQSEFGIQDQFLSPMLASTYDGSQDINGWYLSEKLDGIRCIWDGKSLYSRNGNKFYPPFYFIDEFPRNLTLDGELFMDRNSFQDTVSIVKRQDQNDGWKKIKFIIFDGPKLKGNFEQRLKILEKELKSSSSPYLKLHKQEICKNQEHLERKMQEIISIKGEGVILRDPKSLYENRRSKTMLKVKEFHDAEATVIGIYKGTGRLEKLMGAIECKTKDGIIFRIGTGFTDKERANPFKIGTVVTFRYFELTKDNVPRFPSFVRVHPGF